MAHTYLPQNPAGANGIVKCAHFTNQVRAPVKFESRVKFESSFFFLMPFYYNSCCLNDVTLVNSLKNHV